MNPLDRPLPNGGFWTRNPTSDPRYPSGSYYNSTGWGANHTTFIYGPNGDLLSMGKLNKVISGAEKMLVNSLIKK